MNSGMNPLLVNYENLLEIFRIKFHGCILSGDERVIIDGSRKGKFSNLKIQGKLRNQNDLKSVE